MRWAQGTTPPVREAPEETQTMMAEPPPEIPRMRLASSVTGTVVGVVPVGDPCPDPAVHRERGRWRAQQLLDAFPKLTPTVRGGSAATGHAAEWERVRREHRLQYRQMILLASAIGCAYAEPTLTMTELARKCGTSSERLGHLLEKVGVRERQRRSLPLSESDEETICEMYAAQGFSQADIATRLGFSPTTIHRVLAKHDQLKDPVSITASALRTMLQTTYRRWCADHAGALPTTMQRDAAYGQTVSDWLVEKGY